MTNRRDFLVKCTMAASAASFLKPLDVFAGVGANSPVQSAKNVLTILHTANIEGQWLSLGPNEKLAGLGGLQHIANEIAGIRNNHPSVLVIDAGNITGHRQTRAERLEFYKKVSSAGYDVVIPGPTDLLHGTTCFTELIKDTNLNAVCSGGHLTPDGVLPYSMLKKGKSKIGIINAGTAALKDAHVSAAQAHLAISRTARLLRSSKHCTIILCVVQSSGMECSRLAGVCNGIDVMISASEKTSLYNTQIVRDKINHEVIISYAGSKGSMMSRIDLMFNEKGEKTNVASKAIFTGAADEAYAGIVKKCAMYTA